MTVSPGPSLAVWKFASCDGCQLTLLDCEDELLEVAQSLTISYFLEATSTQTGGPYDLSIVEGSISTPADAERIRHVRRQSRTLVTIGACATAGGIQSLRNFADVEEFLSIVYAQPQFISTLATATPISDHVPVDLELRGCPITKVQLLEVITAILKGRRPNLPGYSVCIECKRRANPCLLVAAGAPCLGPVTHAGCEALCPSYGRGCFGCFGPAESLAGEPDRIGASMIEVLRRAGHDDERIGRLLRTFNAAAPAFRITSEQLSGAFAAVAEAPLDAGGAQ